MLSRQTKEIVFQYAVEALNRGKGVVVDRTGAPVQYHGKIGYKMERRCFREKKT